MTGGVAGVCVVVAGAGAGAGIGVAGAGAGVDGAGAGAGVGVAGGGVAGGVCASPSVATVKRHGSRATPARDIRMPRLPFPNTARAVSVTIAFAVHEDNTLLRGDSAARAATQRVERWTARWTTGGGAGDIGGHLFP
ncbi:MAG: hypothetical protein DMD78_05660 [Candidatus Rokuibacteriota bacterium]|nr:MAG: hypothetical protein DMD78_05660 [Candidatus Rokubacteria bacterium]